MQAGVIERILKHLSVWDPQPETPSPADAEHIHILYSSIACVLPAGFGLPWILLLPTAAIALAVMHRFLGKPVD